MSLTLPQIIMLNHAAWVNQEQGKRRAEFNRNKEKQKAARPLTDAEAFVGGKSLDQMKSEEIAAQFLDMG